MSKRHAVVSISDSESEYDSEDEKRKRVKTKPRPGGATAVSKRTLETLEECHPGIFVKGQPDQIRSSTSGNKKSNKRPPAFVLCTVCNSHVNISSGTKDADNHVKTAKHQISVSGKKGQRDLFTCGVSKSKSDAEDPVLKAELLLSQFVAGCNLPFVKCTELVRICKAAFKDSKIADQIACGATKCTMISKCIGDVYVTDAVSNLKENPFTLMIDESNDHGSNKVLAVLGRVCTRDGLLTQFVTLLPCNIGTALHVFTLIDDFFQ